MVTVDDEVEEMEVEGGVASAGGPESVSKSRRQGPSEGEDDGGHKWQEGKSVMPGDQCSISDLAAPYVEDGAPVLQIGAGLSQQHQDIVVNRAGVLRKIVKKATEKEPTSIRLWVEAGGRRYYPCNQDMVIGVVVNKGGEDFRVDIRGPSTAVLPGLAFEGATRRSRPRLEIGAIVFCKVEHAYRDTEPQLTCISLTDKKGWMTGHTTYGELTGGFLFDVSIGYANSLLHPDNHVLAALGRHLAFEVAVGINGRVWVKAGDVAKTILAVNVIKNSEHRDKAQAQAMIEALAKHQQQD